MTRHVAISPRRRRDIIDALRRGTVPQQGLDVLAVGLARFEAAIDDELDAVAGGGAGFKAVRGEYGSGKTFFARWLAERAKQRGLRDGRDPDQRDRDPAAPARDGLPPGRREPRHPDAPRRVRSATSSTGGSTSSTRTLADGGGHDGTRWRPCCELAQRRLAVIAEEAPAFAAVLRRYRRAPHAGDDAPADGLLAWLGGQPHVAASVKRAAGMRGDLDHFGALGFLQGLLTVLRDSDYAGLVARARRGRDPAAHALRRAGEVAQRAAPAASTRSTAGASRASTS